MRIVYLYETKSTKIIFDNHAGNFYILGPIDETTATEISKELKQDLDKMDKKGTFDLRDVKSVQSSDFNSVESKILQWAVDCERELTTKSLNDYGKALVFPERNGYIKCLALLRNLNPENKNVLINILLEIQDYLENNND